MSTQPPAIYFRRENLRTQTPADAQRQKASGEIWGAPAQQSIFACVKAYIGNLPANVKGIEFITPIPHDPNYSTPWEAHWYHGYTPGVRLNGQGFAYIPATVVKIV